MSGPLLRRAPGAISEVVEGKAFVVVPDGTEVVVLNRTATVVWDLLAAGATLDALVGALSERFPTVAPEALAGDVHAFLADLRAAGLLDG
jgi:hypothetical protein